MMPFSGTKTEDGKEENSEKCERVSPVITNNHNPVDHAEASFSDEETDIIRPIEIESEDEDVPLGEYFHNHSDIRVFSNNKLFVSSVKVKIKEKPPEEVFADALKSLKKEIRDIITQLNKEKNNNRK